MNIFISYARVDKAFCIQLVHKLNVHNVWYDQRLYAGTHWWKEILRRLEWCDVFIYLLSPHSVISEYCLKELDYAQKLGREIIPVLIDPNTELPEALREIHYVDLSTGIGENIADLLNGLYVAAHTMKRKNGNKRQRPPQQPAPELPPYSHSPETVGDAVNAMKNGQYDRAIMLLKQAIARGHNSSFINLGQLLSEAELALKAIEDFREAEMHYKEIYHLFQYEQWQNHACDAFKRFRDVYPDYDPENLAKRCFDLMRVNNPPKPKPPVVKIEEPKQKAPEPILEKGPIEPITRTPKIPMLEWCHIPKGIVKMDDFVGRGQAVHVDSFLISKYPVTNRQFELFIRDKRGYANSRNWSFSKEAMAWHKEHQQPLTSKFQGDDRPRENVSWYEAMAFCHWLRRYAGVEITLPSLSQWLRAAIGDCDYLFPWGNTFDASRCNTRDNRLNQTTQVNRYPDGVSMFGVWDMAGNVWEWCTDKVDPDTQPNDFKRAVIGGSHVSPPDRSQSSVRYFLNPETRFATIGFRIIALAEDVHKLSI